MYLSLLLSTIVMKMENDIYFKMIVFLFVMSIFVLIVELIWCLLRFIYFHLESSIQKNKQQA